VYTNKYFKLVEVIIPIALADGKTMYATRGEVTDLTPLNKQLSYSDEYNLDYNYYIVDKHDQPRDNHTWVSDAIKLAPLYSAATNLLISKGKLGRQDCKELGYKL